MVNPEVFVNVWIQAKRTSKGQNWVAEELKISRQAVSSRAAFYRKKGVKLPELPPASYATRSINVERLNHIIEQAKPGLNNAEEGE